MLRGGWNIPVVDRRDGISARNERGHPEALLAATATLVGVGCKNIIAWSRQHFAWQSVAR